MPDGWKAPAPKPGAAAKVDFMRSEMSKNLDILWTYGYAIPSALWPGSPPSESPKPVGLEVAANAGMAVAAAGVLMTSLTFPFALCNGLGRPIFGTLTDKLTPKKCAMSNLCADHCGLLAALYKLYIRHHVHHSLSPCSGDALAAGWLSHPQQRQASSE